MNCPQGSVLSVLFNHEGTGIISGGFDDIMIWDAHTGKLLNTLVGHTGGINSLVMTHDGSTIISGSRYKTIKIWDAETGYCEKTLYGHMSIISSISI